MKMCWTRNMDNIPQNEDEDYFGDDFETNLEGYVTFVCEECNFSGRSRQDLSFFLYYLSLTSNTYYAHYK